MNSIKEEEELDEGVVVKNGYLIFANGKRVCLENNDLMIYPVRTRDYFLLKPIMFFWFQGIIESDGSFTGDIFKHDGFGESDVKEEQDLYYFEGTRNS